MRTDIMYTKKKNYEEEEVLDLAQYYNKNELDEI